MNLLTFLPSVAPLTSNQTEDSFEHNQISAVPRATYHQCPEGPKQQTFHTC